MLKIIADIIGACVGLIIVLPVITLAIVSILFFDRQNPIFVQQRLGKHKRVFNIVKLRTMKKNQPTTLGNFLRRTGIDELPQLLNILFLQMSFVGPRPLTNADAERLGWNDSFHSKRWNLKPGITGLGQLSPICNKKMSWFLDQKYVACHGFLLDTKILVSSVAILFMGKKKVVQWFHLNHTNESTR